MVLRPWRDPGCWARVAPSLVFGAWDRGLLGFARRSALRRHEARRWEAPHHTTKHLILLVSFDTSIAAGRAEAGCDESASNLSHRDTRQRRTNHPSGTNP